MPNEDLNDLPALYIPTYPPPLSVGDDTGLVRPVPGAVPYYLCPGIQAKTAYHAGSPLTVRVTVGNWGGGNSDCRPMVAVFWSPPFSGMIVPSANRLLGFDQIGLGAHGAQETTREITIDQMPLDAPPHICLLAKVWHARDMPPKTLIGGIEVEMADPVHDRHWGQHNLVDIQAAGPQTIWFLATNPLEGAARFDLLVRPLGASKWFAVADDERGTPVRARASFRLSGLKGDEQTAGDDTLRHTVDLAGGEQRTMVLSLELAAPLEPGTFTAFEVLQFQSDTPVGGFGLVVRAER
jgi:hypothetical protein